MTFTDAMFTDAPVMVVGDAWEERSRTDPRHRARDAGVMLLCRLTDAAAMVVGDAWEERGVQFDRKRPSGSLRLPQLPTGDARIDAILARPESYRCGVLTWEDVHRLGERMGGRPGDAFARPPLVESNYKTIALAFADLVKSCVSRDAAEELFERERRRI